MSWKRVLMIALAAGLVAGGVLALGRSGGRAQQPKPAPPTATEPLTELKIVERVTKATDRALEYLAAKQQPDGSWHRNHAVNALALLAFMGRGHTPGRGPYRDVLEKGKKYLLATQRASDGYISFGQMYEHGLATLALVEMYGMDSDPELEEKVRKAVDLIVRVQSNGGGWNYAPQKGDGDLSVTVMQIVALRAARNAEVPVPEETIKKAIRYVHNHANPSGGGFGYTGPNAGTPQTSAAGTLSLQLVGEYDDPQVAKTLDSLSTLKVGWFNTGASYFYYFHYYAIQAFYQAGGVHWNNWHPQIRELLLEKQAADGSWDVPPGTAENAGVVGPNKVYWTAMASLVLEIYMHFLPAYQR
jgi:prenyltransferase/squalene oxidase-like repeat protein